MRDAVICEPVRTAVGHYGGGFRDVLATALAAGVLRGLLDRTGLPPDRIDDVLLGHSYPNGENPAIGRLAALDIELPFKVTGLQVDRRCGSGLQAVIFAAMQVQTGASDLVLAGGVENMSQCEYYTTSHRWGVRGGNDTLYDRLVRSRVMAGGIHHPIQGGMIETAENLRREYRIPRDQQDELAVQSHHRATEAQTSGKFADEIIPISVPNKSGVTVVDTDEHPRSDTTFEKLSQLRPIMVRDDPESTVTAGNSSGQNDGAAVCIVTTNECADELGLKKFGRLVSWGTAGVSPHTMGIGPVPATRKALHLAGLELSDMDLIELNEAFAAQVLACAHEWKLTDSDFERCNVNGSGIALGHPIGATGARILATLLREMDRRSVRYGLETMCIGGGQGIAAIFERIS